MNQTMRDDYGELDCTACGACCRSGADGRILVTQEDIERWRQTGREDLIARLVPGHFGEMAFETTAEGACVHLGTDKSAELCSIYPDRATVCRTFERGSRQCREFRREYGVAGTKLVTLRTRPQP